MLKQKLILSYTSQIGFQILQIVASIVVARVAGPTVLGTVAFGTAYVSMLLFIADLGLGTAHIKLVSEGIDEGKCIGTYAVLKTTTIMLFVVGIISLYLVQKYIFNKEFESRTHEYVIFISLTALTISQFFFIGRATFAAHTEQAKLAIVDLARGIFLQPLRIIIVLLGFGAVALALGNLASFLILIPVYIFLFRGYPIDKFDWNLAKRYMSISLPVIFIAMSSNLVNHIDKVLLQFFTDSEQVGYYTAGFKVGGFVLLIGKSVRNLFFPLFSKAVAEKNDFYIKDKLAKFERFSFIFIMPFLVLIILFSDTIVLLILGKDYIPAIFIMRVISAAMFIMIINMPYHSVIDGLGKFKLSAIINVINLVFFVALLFALVHPDFLNLKSHGVAMAVFLSNTLIGILFRFYSKKFFPIISQGMPLKFFIFGTVYTILGYIIYNNYIVNSHFLIKILFAVIILFVIYLLFYLLKWIKKDDLKSVKSLTDFGSLKKYITEEIAGRKNRN